VKTIRFLLGGPAAVLLLAGCVGDIPHQEAPAVVVAEFDPAAEPAPLVPKPTDLAYDAAAGRLSVEVEPDDSPAQADLATFLNALDGWPASMPAQATFLGALDPATIDARTVRVFDITDLAAPQPVEHALRFADAMAEGTVLRVHPGLLPTWEPGRRYAVAVLGGGTGVRGATDEEVVSSPAFWFFRSPDPVATCTDQLALTGCRSVTDLIDDADVADLEEIRRDNAEVFDALGSAGVARDDIAVAWSFRTSTRTVVPFDPSVDDVHFPNDYYLADDETQLAVPAPDGSTPAAQAFLARVNLLDGYSLTGSGWMRFVGPLDGRHTNLTPTSLLFLDADDELDMPLVERAWDEARNEVVLAPYRALRSHTRYAAVATDYLEDIDGNRIISSHVWAILKSTNPAADAEGRSLLDGVSDEDARDLEEGRQDYQELFDTLQNRLALPREKVQVGVVFTTQTVVDAMQALRQRPSDEALPTIATAPAGVVDPAAIAPAGMPVAHIGGAVQGVVPGLDVLGPATREIVEGPGRVVELPFLLTLPRTPPVGRAAAPVVLFQHDLRGSRSDAWGVADELADAGYATLAIDLVGHGDRVVLGPDGLPLDPREVLVPVSQPFAVRDAFRQQAVDLVAVVRSLRAADGPAALPGVDLDATDVSFLGVGFGAMAGAIFLAVDPAVRVAVLCGPGGNLGAIVDSSVEFPAGTAGWLEGGLGLDPAREAHHFFRYAWSWAADAGDAAVYARLLIDAPLPDPDAGGTMASKALLIQVPVDDDVIPYDAMRFFWLSAGVEVYPEEFAGAGHGFFLDADDAQGIAARAQAVGFIASGGATVPPAGGK
jgi:hypothetical protein